MKEHAFHALWVSLIWWVGYLALGLWPAAYAGLAATVLKEGSNAYTNARYGDGPGEDLIEGATFDGAIDPGAGEKMGGFQIGFDELVDATTQNFEQLAVPAARNEISPLDIVVIMGFAESTTGTVKMAVSPEEDW